jgi:hypothetical protein
VVALSYSTISEVNYCTYLTVDSRFESELEAVKSATKTAVKGDGIEEIMDTRRRCGVIPANSHKALDNALKAKHLDNSQRWLRMLSLQ